MRSILQAPNGVPVDSTNNVLSHELIETITDPDANAWWNGSDVALDGAEIGDECEFIIANGFNPSIIHADGRIYAVQPEYSNGKHVCATSAAN
jgi:hypothetical protein